MSTIIKSIKEDFISVSQIKTLRSAYLAFKGSAKKTLKEGVKVGLLLIDAKQHFINANPTINEQTRNTKFGIQIFELTGISKTHRNRLMQIAGFKGMIEAVESGKVNSIVEAEKFMKPSQENGSDTESGEENGSSVSNGDESKDFDKVLSLLKQLDKLGINDKLIEAHILKNAAKVLGVEVKRETEAVKKAA